MPKYLSRPQLGRNARGVPDLRNYPAGMQPVNTAPDGGWFYAVRSNGENVLAVRYRGAIQALPEQPDLARRGHGRMMAGAIPDVVGWLPVMKRG